MLVQADSTVTALRSVCIKYASNDAFRPRHTVRIRRSRSGRGHFYLRHRIRDRSGGRLACVCGAESTGFSLLWYAKQAIEETSLTDTT
jgi:hypothetical protein